MKKSKFLKKSLAMLLAVMLVVAMIPLSAAAEEADLHQITVKTGDQGSAQVLEGTGPYTGEIPELADTVILNVYVTSGNEVYYTNDATSTPTEKKADKIDGNNWKIEITGDDLDRYTEGKVISIDITVINGDNNDSTTATVELTKVEMEAEANILDFTVTSQAAGGGDLQQLGDTVIAANTVDITVPYDAAGGAIYTINTMELSPNATAKIGDTVLNEDVRIDNLLTNGQATIVVENQGVAKKEYTLTITPASGFKSFEIEEALDTIVFPDGIIVAMLPYGYTESRKPFSVTANFELDYPSSTATGEDGALNSGDKLTMDKTVYGHNKNGTTVSNDVFEDFAGKNSNTSWSWNVWKADKKTGAAFTNYDQNNPANGYKITVKYSEEASRTYTVYFYEPIENSEAYITELQIGSESVEVAQDAEEINITLPMNTKLGSLNTKGTEVKLTASNGADITIPAATNPTFNCTETKRVRFTSNFTVTNALNASDPVKIKVVSEDGLTEKWYTLNVDCADEFVMPKISSMRLTSADGKIDAKGQLKDVNGTNVYVFDVPYSIQTRAELAKAGWKLFYTKSIGATATVNGDTMPKSGASIASNAAYIPATFGDSTLGASIDLKVTGAEESVNSASYQILINWKAASTVSGLDELKMYGTTEEYTKITEHTTYKGVPGETDDGEKTFDVAVNWTDYAKNHASKHYGMDLVLDDENAKAYIMNGQGQLREIVETVPGEKKGTGVYSFPYKAGTTSSTDYYTGTKIVVLSEQAWVNLQKKNLLNNFLTLQTVKDSSDSKGYTVYTLNITQDDEGKDATLTHLTLVDGTGWEAPVKLVQKNNTIVMEGEIPWALTSDVANKNFNPVYIDFDISNDGLLMAVDTDVANNEVPKMTKVNGHNSVSPQLSWDVPTGNAIFSDIAEYLDENKEYSKDLALSDYRTNHPYLIINRKPAGNGNTTFEVLVYKNGRPVSHTASNELLVVSEDGKAHTTLDFSNTGLTLAPANNEAEFTSFYFKEYPNFKGQIVTDGEGGNNTITVTLPYGTDYPYEVTYMTPVYDTSEGATVTVDDPALSGKPVYSGYTEINFSGTRKFTVRAENETTVREYTVKVVVADCFTDVKEGDWFYKDVMSAGQLGFVGGYEDGTFRPKNSITRAEFVKMLAAAMGWDGSNDCDSPYPDISDDHWAKGAIAFCADREIITGYEDGEFKPTETINRQEVAVMLQRAFNLNGASGDIYPDDAQIAGWASDAVYAVKHAGLMQGDAITDEFAPKNELNRAQAATIMMNAHRNGLIK